MTRRILMTSAIGMAGLTAAGTSTRVRNVVIAKAGPDNPRNDTASVLERRDGSLMVVWHKYAATTASGSIARVAKLVIETLLAIRRHDGRRRTSSAKVARL